MMPLSSFLRPQCLLQTVRIWRAVAPRSFRRCITTSVALPAQVSDPETELRKIRLPAISLQHDSLESFLAYTERTGISRSTPVWKGTHYEYTAAKYLQRLGFSLVRVGGSNDSGIDLVGYWILPELPAPIPVIIQCKLRIRPETIGPLHIRELRGAFQGAPPGWGTPDVPVMALLVVSGKPSKCAIEALAGVRRPMGFINMTTGGIIEQFVWNTSARVRLLEGVGVTLRHSPRELLAEEELSMELGPHGTSSDRVQATVQKELESTGVTGIRRDIQLTWMGLPMFPDEERTQQATARLMGELGKKQTLQSAQNDVSSVAIPVKRGRGRPRKIAVPTIASSLLQTSHAVPAKRGRGRPRKIAVPTIASSLPQASLAVPAKRGRGRPRGSKNKSGVGSALSSMEEAGSVGHTPVLVTTALGERRPRSLNWSTLRDRAQQGAIDSPHSGIRNLADTQGETAYSMSVKYMGALSRNLKTKHRKQRPEG